MISKKYIILIILLVLLPLASLLLRPTMIGSDSYAYINAICSMADMPNYTLPIASVIFDNLPCDFTALKLVTWFFYLLFMGVIALLGYELFGKPGLIAPLFAWLAGYFLEFPWELENDLFAVPLLWFSYWLFLKNKKIEALILILFVGWGIWGGAWIFLFALGVAWWPALLVGIAVLAWQWQPIIGTFLPNKLIGENSLGAFDALGIISLGWLGFLKITKDLKGKKLQLEEKLKVLLPIAVFWLAVAFINGKYAYHAVPILAIGFTSLYLRLSQEWKQYLLAITTVSLVVLIFYGMQVTFPHEDSWQAVQETAKLSKDNNMQVFNDWSVGYYLEFFGIKASNKGSPPAIGKELRFELEYPKNSLILTTYDLNKYKKLKSIGAYNIYQT